ncbi:MAG: hypothetical protein KAV82_03570 [Phycisphaerae bacterium]|nr:hypothetical protein [Phycisphaerae bacterium]
MADKTPYGLSKAFGARALAQTCWWVCGASSQRLAHLALLPRSSASRRFVFWMIMLLSSAAMLLQVGLVGWHTVTNAPTDVTSPAPTPGGRGWYHLAGADPPPPYRGRAVPTDVWWNPTQTILAAAGTFVGMIVISWIILACQRAGAQLALGPKYRHQGRLEAALHYGAAWLAPLFPVAAIASLRMLPDISAAARWPVSIPPAVIFALAVVPAAISVFGYGFGLIRVATAAPIAVRMRVVVFFALWNPLIILWWVVVLCTGLYFGMRLLVPQLELGW